MKRYEEAVALLSLVMGLLLMWEGRADLLASRPAQRDSPGGLVLVLVGPDGPQKAAQAAFLASRYRLHRATRAQVGGGSRFLLADYQPGASEARYLATLAREASLPAPVFIELADRRAMPAWDVYTAQSFYPNANIWTFDGSRPPAEISATLARLLDSAAR